MLSNDRSRLAAERDCRECCSAASSRPSTTTSSFSADRSSIATTTTLSTTARWQTTTATIKCRRPSGQTAICRRTRTCAIPVRTVVGSGEPSTAFLVHALRTREWPFWDPYVAAGAPAMANLIPAFFFPPYMAVAALGASVGLRDADSLALLWAASFFTYLFLKRHGLGFMASIAGGALVYDERRVESYKPWLIHGADGVLSAGGCLRDQLVPRPSVRRRVAGLAAIYASVALASFPPLLFPIFGIVAIYGTCGHRYRDRRCHKPSTDRSRHWTMAVASVAGCGGVRRWPAIALRQDAPQVALMDNSLTPP